MKVKKDDDEAEMQAGVRESTNQAVVEPEREIMIAHLGEKKAQEKMRTLRTDWLFG